MPFRFDSSLRSVALTATIAAAAGIHDVESPAKSATVLCTMEILPGARDSLTTTLLGHAGHDTVVAGAGVVADRWILGRFAPSIHGQIVRVDSMLGPGASRTRLAFGARQSTEVVIVPWGHNGGCGIALWQHSALWLRPDSAGLFSVRLRPESLWVSGQPTFDAFFAVNYSYADGPQTIGPHSKAGSMTPAEVFSLYAALPAVGQPADSIAIGRIRAWIRANPSARTTYPGNQILQWWPLDPRR